MTKYITIECDICKGACNPPDYGCYVYSQVSVGKDKGFQRQMVEEHYCGNCIIKVNQSLNELKKSYG